MSEPNSKLLRDDPATYYVELGAKSERERIIKLLEEDCECEYHDGYPPMICYPHRLIALIKREAE